MFLTLSVLNRCGYCVGAHSSLADRSKVPHEGTDAVRHGGPIPDERLAALSAFTRTMATTGGRPARAEVEAFLTAGYTELQVLNLILALAVKTLSNNSNHLFHTPLDTVFAARTWEG